MQSILIIIYQNSKGRSARLIGVAEAVLARLDFNNRILAVLLSAHDPVAVAKWLAALPYVRGLRSGKAHSRAAVGGDRQIQTHAVAFEAPICADAAVRRVMLGSRMCEAASRLHLY